MPSRRLARAAAVLLVVAVGGPAAPPAAARQDETITVPMDPRLVQAPADVQFREALAAARARLAAGGAP